MAIERIFGGHIFFAREGELTLTIINDSVSDDEWRSLLELARIGGTSSASLAYQPKGSTTVMQRRMAAGQAEKNNFPPPKAVALISDSLAIRGTLTAYSWLLGGKTSYAGFPRAQLDEALGWLADWCKFDAVAVKNLFKMMCQEAGVP